MKSDGGCPMFLGLRKGFLNLITFLHSIITLILKEIPKKIISYFLLRDILVVSHQKVITRVLTCVDGFIFYPIKSSSCIGSHV